MSRERIALALDVPDLATARAWVERMRSEVGVFKVGLELFCAEGRRAVDAVDAGRCFLDLKLHDIPATMARAAKVVSGLGVRYLTIHAAAGPAAIAATREAVEGTATELLAVTVLTSLDEGALDAIGLRGPAEDAVVRLGSMAIGAGAHGLVCSARECAPLRARLPAATLVVPGIRPAGAATQDQKRVATPARAVADGADLLVVGRPIRRASDPVAAARAIAAEIA